ncbi:retrotransposon 4 protein [Nephila pilipes]|uniref:Retrotransposon 4 protein n=1 Tax=Nephila pilipes TaxID=299642 RepID=A0A8X6MB89_NEPPI|nr:retrotransposon 4 protein [Nephila pilipes]
MKREETSSDSQTDTEVSNNCDVIPPCRSVNHRAPGRPRILRTGKRGRPRKEYGQVSITTDYFGTSPRVQEAFTGPNKTDGENAMKEEHDALIKENAWTLVPRPNHKMVIGSKWILKTKFKEDGTVEKLK